jgi:acyl-CoA reductase-like NAD-dependent aldehyde dehydrogenase
MGGFRAVLIQVLINNKVSFCTVKEIMENIYHIYVGGDFQKTDDLLTVRNPFNNKKVADTFRAGETILEEAILKALAVQDELGELPSWQRHKILLHIAALLEEAKNEFAEIICMESAKPMRYALSEVDRAIQTFIVAAEECKRLPAEYIDIEWTKAGAGKEGILRYFPLGLIAGISPFNFPLNLAVHKIAPAIAAGCPIILKPSSSTPLSTLALARIIDKSDLPKGAVSILPMSRETGNHLVTDDRFSMLSFTGSADIGWKMKSDAGKKKVVLELGGNAGVIVSPTADIEDAVNKCLTGGFAYSGQVCISTQRIYLHESIFDTFKEEYITGAKSLKNGDPLEAQTEISSMIDEANAIRVENWVKDAVANGADLLCGGNRLGNYLEPTVITNVASELKLCAMEAFGPVVVIEKYKEFSEAVAALNNSTYGLQAGVFTNQIDEMNFAFRKLEVGGVILNDVPGFRVDHMPYGGIKDSGLGREGVKYSIHDMLEPKLLIKSI